MAKYDSGGLMIKYIFTVAEIVEQTSLLLSLQQHRHSRGPANPGDRLLEKRFFFKRTFSLFPRASQQHSPQASAVISSIMLEPHSNALLRMQGKERRRADEECIFILDAASTGTTQSCASAVAFETDSSSNGHGEPVVDANPEHRYQHS